MSENQFLRWGIPGWIFILVVVSYWLLTPSFVLQEIVKKDYNLVAPVTFILGAGIPIGFIIYQFYFQLDWLFHRRLKVAEKLLKDVKDVPVVEVYNYSVYKFQEDIQIVEYLWNKKIFNLGTDADFLKERHRHMISVLHSLGAWVCQDFCVNSINRYLNRFHPPNWNIFFVANRVKGVRRSEPLTRWWRER